MNCPQCNSEKIASIDHQQTCLHCGTILAQEFTAEYIVQMNDDNEEEDDEEETLILEKSRAKKIQRGDTRKEKAFLSRIRQYANVLGLSNFILESQQIYFTHREAISTIRTKYSPEMTVSLIYYASRTTRPGFTLVDYAKTLGITNVRALNTAFKRLSNTIKGATPIPTHPSPPLLETSIPLPTSSVTSPATTDNHISVRKSKIAIMISKLFEPILNMFSLEASDIDDLNYWSELTCIVAENAGLDTGRHEAPITVACVVIGARAAGNVSTNSRGDLEIDWKELAQHVSYGYTTIQRRYAELIRILKLYAKTIPLFAEITNLKLAKHLREIIRLGAYSSYRAFELQPPSFKRNQALVQQRSAQIATASKFLIPTPLSPNTTISTENEKELLSLDPEVRMIYFLLLKNIPESEIQGMQSHQIYENVNRLYMQKLSLSTEDMDSSELTEKDMDDNELATYLK